MPHDTALKPRKLSTAASRPLGPAELLLVEHCERQHERKAGRPISGAHLVAALKKVQRDAPAANLPEHVCDVIVSRLDSEAKTALTQIWMNRLQPATRQSILHKAGRAYGFKGSPPRKGWQAYLEGLDAARDESPENRLISRLRTMVSTTKADAVLAGLLLGTMIPGRAIEQYPASREVVMRAVEHRGWWSLASASAELRDDREVVMHTVEHNGLALEDASERLRGDREIVTRAIDQTSFALKYASPSLQDDREVVMRANEQDGWGLKYASKRLRNDRSVVMHAVERYSRALEYASPSLRDDRVVVMHAIETNGTALAFASEALRGNRAVVTHAVERCGFCAIACQRGTAKRPRDGFVCRRTRWLGTRARQRRIQKRPCDGHVCRWARRRGPKICQCGAPKRPRGGYVCRWARRRGPKICQCGAPKRPRGSHARRQTKHLRSKRRKPDTPA